MLLDREVLQDRMLERREAFDRLGKEAVRTGRHRLGLDLGTGLTGRGEERGRSLLRVCQRADQRESIAVRQAQIDDRDPCAIGAEMPFRRRNAIRAADARPGSQRQQPDRLGRVAAVFDEKHRLTKQRPLRCRNGTGHHGRVRQIGHWHNGSS